MVLKSSRKIVALETAEGADALIKRVFPTGYLGHFDTCVLMD
ncbi:MAG: hypothetical protein N3E52_04315 [Candidatus Bathyarchaeota archaeon]|nr:hypothetical protein [Candidatus Bathyarchaeota archaeon]